MPVSSADAAPAVLFPSPQFLWLAVSAVPSPQSASESWLIGTSATPLVYFVTDGTSAAAAAPSHEPVPEDVSVPHPDQSWYLPVLEMMYQYTHNITHITET